MTFTAGLISGAVASFVLVALAYRAVLRGVMSEQQDRVAALKAERDEAWSELKAMRERAEPRRVVGRRIVERGPYRA